MHFSRERMIPTILFTGNSQSRATESATIIFEVADERPLDSQNIKYNSFFRQAAIVDGVYCSRIYSKIIR